MNTASAAYALELLMYCLIRVGRPIVVSTYLAASVATLIWS
jgi:hypothetical protein